MTEQIARSRQTKSPLMLRLATGLLGLLVVVSGSDLAEGKPCQDAPAERQEIRVPPYVNVRVMFFRRGAKASYVEICKISGHETKLIFAAATEAGAWYHAVNFSAESGSFYVKNYAAQLVGPIRRRWVGMRRVAAPHGYVFNWFDEAGKFDPNTIVEFCLYTELAKCPNHFPAKDATNLAHMSDYGRQRWLARWTKRHGYEKHPH